MVVSLSFAGEGGRKVSKHPVCLKENVIALLQINFDQINDFIFNEF